MNKNALWVQTASFFILLLVSIALARVLGISVPISVTTSQVSSELSVVGEGKVDVIPDTAYVDVGVSFDSVATADEAQKRLSEQNNKIIAAMKALGISEENIKTSNFSISPNYTYDGTRSRQNGFIGNAMITVKTEKTDLGGRIIEEATKAGATQVGSARFVVDKPENYREQAREKAIANAKEQAEKIAGTLGIKLGKVTNVVESSQSSVPPILYAEKSLSAGMGGAPTPDLAAGSQTISSTVTLFFEKK